MNKTLNRVISSFLAMIFALGVFIFPNSLSDTASIVSYAADVTLDSPELISVKKNYIKLTVSWSEVKGANAYQVYIKENENDEFSKVRTTSKTTCTINENLKPATIYYVKITPIQLDNKKIKARGKSLVIKTNTQNFDDKLKNLKYTPTEVVWADSTAFGGGIYNEPATAYFTLSWDDIENVSYYRIYFRTKSYYGYDEVFAEPELSHENGRTIAKIKYSCGSKISCVIYPIHGLATKGKGTVVNLTTYAPNVTSINFADRGYTKSKANTYYAAGDSLLSAGLSVSMILASYGYDISFNSKASSNTKYVYKVTYGSVTVGTLTLTETSSGVTFTLKDSGNHIMYVESPKTVQLYL